MTAADIVHIVWTVAWIQALGELIAYWRIYRSAAYERSLEVWQRCQFNRTRCLADPKAPLKKRERVEQDHANAMADIAKHHVWHNLLLSMVFIILFRILGAEYGGRVIAVLPFRPMSLLQRITLRKLDFSHATSLFQVTSAVGDVAQAGAFAVIYLLTTLSVKYYMQQALGTAPPPGVESFTAVLNTPSGQATMKQFGLDPSVLKDSRTRNIHEL
jgi:hypothetical protein